MSIGIVAFGQTSYTSFSKFAIGSSCVHKLKLTVLKQPSKLGLVTLAKISLQFVVTLINSPVSIGSVLSTHSSKD